MAFYLLASRITDESVAPVLEFLNNNSGAVTIGIRSGGGYIHDGLLLSHALELNKDRVSLVCVYQACSTAFEIFKRFPGKKYLTWGCMGMYHYGVTAIDTDDRGKPAYSETECQKRNLKHQKLYVDTFSKEFMNRKELNKLKKGEDIWFDFDRMQQIFPNAEVIA
jgi:hypothetical protein